MSEFEHASSYNREDQQNTLAEVEQQREVFTKPGAWFDWCWAVRVAEVSFLPFLGLPQAEYDLFSFVPP